MSQVFRHVCSKEVHRMSNRSLVVFDFDHTIVDDNTDTVARSLVPKSLLVSAEEEYKKTDSWTLYMKEIFNCLHKVNVSEQKIISAIQSVQPIKDMVKLIRMLSNDHYEMIIISDSNSVFINEWLSFYKLDGIFQKVITNPAWFDKSGLLNIEFYQHQTFCKISEPNLCKGHAMDTYRNERRNENVMFDSVFFIGDGSNDYCPALRLGENDFLFPRIDYSLFKKIKDNEGSIKAKVYPWNDGADIIKVFKEIVL